MGVVISCLDLVRRARTGAFGRSELNDALGIFIRPLIDGIDKLLKRLREVFVLVVDHKEFSPDGGIRD